MEGFFFPLHFFTVLRIVIRKHDFTVPGFPRLLMQGCSGPLDGFAFFLLG